MTATSSAAGEPVSDSRTARGIDLVALEADLDAEVHRLRASGRVSSTYERELTGAFARLVPSSGSDAELTRALQTLDEKSFIRGEIPIEEGERAVVFAKRLLRKSMAWYMKFLARQAMDMGEANLRMHRILIERCAEVAARVPRELPPHLQYAGRGEGDAGSAWSAEIVAGVFAGVTGRILHAEAGDGAVLSALAASGLDAYGVEPAAELADHAIAIGLDVWPDDPRDHLSQVADDALGGLVLSGLVDRLAVGDLWELLQRARLKLRDGAPLAVVGRSPESWRRRTGPLESDLAVGRPLHPQTWRALMEASAFADIRIHPGPVTEQLTEEPAASPQATGNIRLLNEVLFGPEGTVVTGVKAS